MAEFTKGEWKREGNKITKGGQGIIAICPSPNTGGVFEFIANSHLIAASPKMYETLLAMRTWYFKKGLDRELPEFRAVQSAIALVEGKEG